MSEIKPNNLLRHELLGLGCKVVKATNPSLVGLEGTAMDETKNMITLGVRGMEKRIPKREAVFQFTLRGGTKVEVDGKGLVGRPEDRVKRR
ncbi:MAG: ribonuclease P protein component 1 [Candidatus Hydrothermarchaeota archaeon]